MKYICFNAAPSISRIFLVGVLGVKDNCIVKVSNWITFPGIIYVWELCLLPFIFEIPCNDSGLFTLITLEMTLGYKIFLCSFWEQWGINSKPLSVIKAYVLKVHKKSMLKISC